MRTTERHYFENFPIRDLQKKEGKHQFEDLSKKIIGAAIQVHRELGPGFLQNIYEKASRVDLYEHGLHFESQ